MGGVVTQQLSGDASQEFAALGSCRVSGRVEVVGSSFQGGEPGVGMAVPTRFEAGSLFGPDRIRCRDEEFLQHPSEVAPDGRS